MAFKRSGVQVPYPPLVGYLRVAESPKNPQETGFLFRVALRFAKHFHLFPCLGASDFAARHLRGPRVQSGHRSLASSGARQWLGVAGVHFHRQAPTLEEAIRSAVADVAKAGVTVERQLSK